MCKDPSLDQAAESGPKSSERTMAEVQMSEISRRTGVVSFLPLRLGIS